jgi:hypothetical protein
MARLKFQEALGSFIARTRRAPSLRCSTGAGVKLSGQSISAASRRAIRRRAEPPVVSQFEVPISTRTAVAGGAKIKLSEGAYRL